jgi:hypothetical protein
VLIDTVGMTAVLLVGAAVALVLASTVDLHGSRRARLAAPA